MDGVVSLTEYYAAEQNLLLGYAAYTVYNEIKGMSHAKDVKVLTDQVDLHTLEPGYYMRFITFGENQFHLYGIEVSSPTDTWVHENIPEKQLNNHKDEIFLETLIELNKSNRVIFYKARPGEGINLHAQLAKSYVEKRQKDELEHMADTTEPALRSGEPKKSKSSSLSTPLESVSTTVPSPPIAKVGPPKAPLESSTGKDSVLSPEEDMLDEEFREAQTEILSLLNKLHKKIQMEKNESIKQSATDIYLELDNVYHEYLNKRIDKKDLKTQMQEIVEPAIDKFDKAPSWKTFFLNFLRTIANLFLSKQNKYSMFRPKSHEGFKDAKQDLEQLENKGSYKK